MPKWPSMRPAAVRGATDLFQYGGRGRQRREPAGRKRVGIEALFRIPMDGEEFPHHAHSVAHEPNFGPRLVGPIDRDFGNSVSPALGNEEQFQVEAVAVDARHREEILRHGALEQFESALGVGNPANASQSDHGVEAAPQQAAVPTGLDCEVGPP